MICFSMYLYKGIPPFKAPLPKILDPITIGIDIMGN